MEYRTGSKRIQCVTNGGPGSGPRKGYVIQRVHGIVSHLGVGGEYGSTPWDVPRPFVSRKEAEEHLAANPHLHNPGNKSFASIKEIDGLTKKQLKAMKGGK